MEYSKSAYSKSCSPSCWTMMATIQLIDLFIIKVYLRAFLFLGCTLTAGKSFSQKTVFYDITKLEAKAGLSSPNVRKIIQDEYGFMWIATQDGLNRFDGVDFIRFNGGMPDPGRRLIGSDVYDVVAEKGSNTIWALTAYGGLNK